MANYESSDSDAEHEETGGPNWYVFSCLFVLPTLLFFSLFFFPVISFSINYKYRFGGTGREKRRRQQKHGMERGGGGVGHIFCCLYSTFSTLFYFSSSHSSFFYDHLFLRYVQSIVQQQRRRGGMGRERRGCKATQDRTGRGGGVGADEHIFCCFFSTFSTLLYYYYSHSYSPTIMEGRSRAVRDVIRPTPVVTTTLDGTAGQVGDGWEEEVEGWG